MQHIYSTLQGVTRAHSQVCGSQRKRGNLLRTEEEEWTPVAKGSIQRKRGCSLFTWNWTLVAKGSIQPSAVQVPLLCMAILLDDEPILLDG